MANVQFKGYITLMDGDKSKKIKINDTQKVLFTNNGKLYLDEAGHIQEK
ncbi:MAG: hypothetical protein LRY27_01630 [Chitinophagales bacterium]|nr:hypothetical protein [Chitinophagales bacterium]